jgi:putative tricarboxylic transport membrane protein
MHRETLLEAAVESLDVEAVERNGDMAARTSVWGRSAIVPVAIAVAGVIAFVAIVDWLGFILTAFLLMAALMKYLGTRLQVAILASGVCAVAVYQLFAIGMRVSLPRGWLGW